MQHRLIIIMTVFLGAFAARVEAQDPTFSQAFMSPIYMNPAATGAGEMDGRLSFIHRRQWLSIPSSFNYSAVSYDRFMPSISSGIGFMGTHSTEGYLKKTGVYATYAYTICAGTRSVAENADLPKWFWSGGLQAGMQQRRVDYSKLVFADELDINGVIPNYISDADRAINNNKWFWDFAAGTYFNYNLTGTSRILTGISAHHINKPDESLTNTADTARSILPVRWTGNLMYTYTNPDLRWSYSVSALGYRQATHTNYQLGVEFTQNQYDVSIGAWYRSSAIFTDMHTVGISVTFNLTGRDNTREIIRAGVGHDASMGGKSYSYTSGSTEAAVVWEHASYNSNSDDPCKPRISSQSACPVR
jgi:type IX secretion system PorP/SprF family membrane protein